MTNPKSPIAATNDLIRADRQRLAASLRTRYSGESVVSRALSQVAEIARHVERGDEPMAREARRTLNDLCWSPVHGYPASVRDALEGAGLRTTA